jgi:uncharacterized cupredoxin-like copper-binding protein
VNRIIWAGVLGAVMTGCASSQNSTAATTFTRTDTGATVEVLLDEYKIHMPTTIPGGDITFHVKNTGDHRHNIEVEGSGVDAKLPKDLGPGEGADLHVQLAPGVYKVLCPVGPHAAMGMRLELTVTKR